MFPRGFRAARIPPDPRAREGQAFSSFFGDFYFPQAFSRGKIFVLSRARDGVSRRILRHDN